MTYKPDTDWPHPFEPTSDDMYNWVCSDGIKWYSEREAIRYQVELEHEVWKKLQLGNVAALCRMNGKDEPNEHMMLNVAFTTVLTMAALFAKELYLEHDILEPNLDDENMLIALRKVTNLACYMYDKPSNH